MRSLWVVLLTLLPVVSADAQPATQADHIALETRLRGYWMDPSTGLTWAARDNFGRDLNWRQAAKYCLDLQLAGYDDWRLPAIEELEGIYDNGAGALGLGGRRNEKRYTFHVQGDLFLTGDSWSATHLVGAHGAPSGWALLFDFGNGRRYDDEERFRTGKRALCVRTEGVQRAPRPGSQAFSRGFTRLDEGGDC